MVMMMEDTSDGDGDEDDSNDDGDDDEQPFPLDVLHMSVCPVTGPE